MILTKRTASHEYNTFVRKLELMHSERELFVMPQALLLISITCVNLEEISITFASPRRVPAAPPPTPDRPHLPGHIHLPPAAAAAVAAAAAALPHPPSFHSTHTHALPLSHLAHNCPRLHTIHLMSYSPKNDDTLYDLAKHLTPGTLRSLTLSSCATLQGSTVRRFVKSQPSLRCLELLGRDTALTDTSIAAIVESCGPSLEILSVGNAHHLTDASISLIPGACANLRELCLIDNHPEHVSEATLAGIVAGCARLEVLSVSNARVVGEQFLGVVVERVEEEVGREAKGEWGGGYLRRLCLGSVRREIPRLPAMGRLIELGGGVDPSDEEDEGEEDEEEWGDERRTEGARSVGMRLRKANVVTGNSVWWQRRRRKRK